MTDPVIPQKSGIIDLKQYGISREMAAELRDAFQCFAVEWDSPEMAIYDDYYTNLAALKSVDQTLPLTPGP